jgi:hypothetical protein
MLKDITELSWTINTAELPSGMLIYNLTLEGQVLETGKLVVME